MKKSLFAALAVLALVLALCGCAGANAPVRISDAPDGGNEGGETGDPLFYAAAVKSINGQGDVVLDMTFDEMKERGVEVGDIVTVSVGGREYDVPVGTALTDVDGGSAVCLFDPDDGGVAIAVNAGSFASKAGIGEKQLLEAEPGYGWDVKISVLGIALKEKRGYLGEYTVRNLTRTDAREDFPDLSDEEFANFRAVAVGGMKENVLYRSGTPLEPAVGRNEYAMAATEKAGIKSVLNLCDSVGTMTGYEAYAGSYYSKCNTVNPEMNNDFGTDEFAAKVKDCALFIVDSEGPYLIHCEDGGDRTGILCAILGCFAGASFSEISDDYMLTYRNYYGVRQGDENYVILNNRFVKTLCGLFGVDAPGEADLKAEAAEYLLSAGMTAYQLDALGARLLK